MPQQPPALLAKAALRRLALDKLEPTPENYAAPMRRSPASPPAAARARSSERAQASVARLLGLAVPDPQQRQGFATQVREGRWDELQRALEGLQQTHGPGAQAEQLAQLIERMMRGLERGGRQWTLARKKDGVLRVLQSNRSDPQRLTLRLKQLVASWDSDVGDSRVETQPAPLDELPSTVGSGAARAASVAQDDDDEDEERAGTPTQFFTDEEIAQPPAEAGAAAAPQCGRRALRHARHADGWLDRRHRGHRDVGHLRRRPAIVAGGRHALERHRAARTALGRRAGAGTDRRTGRGACGAHPRRRDARALGADGCAVHPRAALAGPPQSRVHRAGQALRRADRQPDRPGRGRLLGARPVRGDEPDAGAGPDGAQRALGQRAAAQHARAPAPACARNAAAPATRSRA
ncbi:hypothetical protein ACFJIX_15045 [Roseateles sp. UC29_93]|uniref:hypothetical protein n=1 Tax=Roseateles sp. UC29_93 TaxID=3350177 RepID=UPI00366F8450